MVDADYQMALLLQSQFEEEKPRNSHDADLQLALQLQEQFKQELAKEKPKTNLVCDSKRNSVDSTKSIMDPLMQDDLLLAMDLQEQFEQEVAVEKPKGDLVYDDKKKLRRVSEMTNSLVDPSWEVIDPTPDIHILFLTYNDRFFWSKLQAVCVDWSKRMTTCAGVCSYARGGMCRITLSEPLLKLRPRRDLVETLLHEMIHAFLFVTNNYKDRDSHGPEFLKHMYRINDQAGRNFV